MIQPIGMSESLQRALMGLGGIGTAIQDARKTQAGVANTNAQTAATVVDTAGKDTANQQALLSFRNSMRQRQLLDSLSSNEAQTQQLQSAGPQAAQDPLNGAAGPLAPGQERIPATPGVLSNAGMASLQQMPQDHARLVAQLQRESGAFGATPELAQAQHAASLTQTQNAGAMSNLDVAGKQTANDTNALALSTAKATQPAAIAAANQEPLLGQKKIGLMGAQANEAGAAAQKDISEGHKAEAEAGRGGMTVAAQNSMVKYYGNQIKEEEKPYVEAASAYGNAKALVDGKDPSKLTGLEQKELVMALGKINNPGGVVRQGTMNMYLRSMGIKDSYDVLMNKLEGGNQVLSPANVQNILSMMDREIANKGVEHDKMISSIRDEVSQTPGLDFGKIYQPKLDFSPGKSSTTTTTKIKDDADYDKLKSGDHFVGPDGVERIKP